ncbi:hypothetical protein J7K24_00185 [bacterium]|nr:hypothetical protein [bacterium]
MEEEKCKEKEKIVEGKTKIIWRVNASTVEIESKPDITARNGKKRDKIPGKEILANNIACNVFEFLNSKRVKTHFIKRYSEKSFLAKLCEMVPVEVVVRRYALGSYLKRHPEIPKFFRFKKPIVELFYKSDKLRDPYIITQGNQKRIDWILYEAKEPLSTNSFLGRISASWSLKEEKLAIKKAKKTFILLERVFRDLGYILADLKVEFGRTTEGEIVIADVIDNDSWRLLTEEGEHLDKQLYREGKDLDTVRTKYEIVSQITNSLKNYI